MRWDDYRIYLARDEEHNIIIVLLYVLRDTPNDREHDAILDRMYALHQSFVFQGHDLTESQYRDLHERARDLGLNLEYIPHIDDVPDNGDGEVSPDRLHPSEKSRAMQERWQRRQHWSKYFHREFGMDYVFTCKAAKQCANKRKKMFA